MSIFNCWKYFCARFFHNWCKNNASCGLLVDSSAAAVGLIRKSSVSLFRSLEDIERIIEGNYRYFTVSLFSLPKFYFIPSKNIFLAFLLGR